MYKKVTDRLCRLFNVQRYIYEKTRLLSSDTPVALEPFLKVLVDSTYRIDSSDRANYTVEITKQDCYCSSTCNCSSDLVLTKITKKSDEEVLKEINSASDKQKALVEKKLAVEKQKEQKKLAKKLEKLNKLGRELEGSSWVDKTIEDLKGDNDD
mgnify:CR=1 FL=1